MIILRSFLYLRLILLWGFLFYCSRICTDWRSAQEKECSRRRVSQLHACQQLPATETACMWSVLCISRYSWQWSTAGRSFWWQTASGIHQNQRKAVWSGSKYCIRMCWLVLQIAETIILFKFLCRCKVWYSDSGISEDLSLLWYDTCLFDIVSHHRTLPYPASLSWSRL